MKINGKLLLICDDASFTAYLLEGLLRLGDFTIVEKQGLAQGLEAKKEESFDLLFLRHGMPGLDIGNFMAEVRKIDSDCIVILLVGQLDDNEIENLAEMGIYDFISRRTSQERINFVVDKGIRLHGLLASARRLNVGLKETNSSLEKQNILLAKRIEDSAKSLSRLYEDLRSTYMRTIRVLAQAIDARDHYTHSHSENVARYAVAIASQMNLPAKEIELIRQACELHDLGKIGIEDSILLKPSELNTMEWEQIKKHPTIGAQILEPLTFLNGVVDLIRQHHEHYDGTGYPEGRKGEDILLGARIIHIADAYEAMCSARSYRKTPFSKMQAIEEIKKNSGTQFDPKIVEVFLKVADNL
ncbi:MAG: HD domain-containing protein [Candidatus Omnitrophica bacterium]|jgi:putative nucleotidyltransferase with HDIG domain|nr:HD domain-containing protein [Candidatus Omnitrophota bacterium]